MKLTFHQLFYRAFNGQNGFLQPAREELGLSRGQPRILTYLMKFGESSQNEIASYCQLDPASVSRMTDNLQKNGFLVRKEDTECRRANKLSLTDKGLNTAKTWEERCHQVEKIMLKGFSEEETEELYSFLSRVVENYSQEKEQ